MPADVSDRYPEYVALGVFLLPDSIGCPPFDSKFGSDAGAVEISLLTVSVSPGSYRLEDQRFYTEPSFVVAGRSYLQQGEVDLTDVGAAQLVGSFHAYNEYPDGGVVSLSGTFNASRCWF